MCVRFGGESTKCVCLRDLSDLSDESTDVCERFVRFGLSVCV
jgi:hypothetical protein